MRLTTPYVGEEPLRALSPDVWKHVLARYSNGEDVFDYETDFDQMPITTEDSHLLTAGAATQTISTTDLGGVFKQLLVTTAQLNNIALLGVHPQCNINPGNGVMGFEIAFRKTQITAQCQSILLGLQNGQTDATSGNFQTATTHVPLEATLNFVGACSLPAATQTLLAVHKDAGTAYTSLGTLGTIVANQWHKFGMNFDGTRTRWFFDGVEKYSVLTDVTNFPEDKALWAVLSAIQGTTSTTGNLETDWVKCMQIKT